MLFELIARAIQEIATAVSVVFLPVFLYHGIRAFRRIADED